MDELPVDRMADIFRELAAVEAEMKRIKRDVSERESRYRELEAHARLIRSLLQRAEPKERSRQSEGLIRENGLELGNRH